MKITSVFGNYFDIFKIFEITIRERVFGCFRKRAVFCRTKIVGRATDLQFFRAWIVIVLNTILDLGGT